MRHILAWSYGYSRMVMVAELNVLFRLSSLFPTMPRHNLYKIKPQVEALCAKHGIPYQCKTLSEAFHDIVKYVISSIFMMSLKNMDLRDEYDCKL